MRRVVVPAAAAFAIAFGATAGQAQPLARIVFAADRTPSLTGEIYRLAPDGRRVDLSKSPYQDLYPAVSWDGKRVAFVSERNGKTAVWRVGIDGRGLRPLGLSIASVYAAGCQPQLLWQPHGDVLAVTACGGLKGFLWIIRPGRKPLELIDGSRNGIQGASWSPDGRILVASSFPGTLRAFSPAGIPLWKADGTCCGSWSGGGLLAVPLGSHFGFRVYDESGHSRFSASGTLDSNLAWSAEGGLAVIRNHRLETRTATGALVFGKSLAGHHGLVWADAGHVVVGGYGTCYCKAKSVDVRTGKVSSASGNWFGTLSPDRRLAIVTLAAKPPRPFRIGVAPPSGGAIETYASLGGCYSDGAWTVAATSVQFAGPTRSLVYQSGNYCDPPFANLYSASAGGGDVTRLTHSFAQETQPAVSPDGNRIAFVWAKFTGLSCKGCSDGIRLVNGNGKGGRTLTNPEDCTFDDSPAWSPDGSTVLFAESTCDTGGELFTIPASGGAPHDLGIKGDNPAWGPTRIAYNGTKGLTTANPDGSDAKVVSRNGDHPAWSPNGTLAYRLGKYVVVGATKITLPFAQVTSVRWSPNGTRLVVTASKTKRGSLDVYTVKTDGTDPVRLTKNYGVLAWIG